MQDADIKRKIWEQILKGEAKIELTFFPAKLLAKKWQTSLSVAYSPDKLETGKKELFNLYKTNMHLSQAQKDIMTILQHP